MPDYDFEDVETRQVVELTMLASEAVPIGEVIERDGRRLRRLPSCSHGMVEPEWAHKCFTMSDAEALKYAPRVDENGFGVFRNKQEILNAQARMAADGKTLTYDFGKFGGSRFR